MKKIFIPLLLFLLLPTIAKAQFKGGIDDGVAFKSLTGQNQIPNIFRGGNDDGMSINKSIGQNPFPTIYRGGANDGITSFNASIQNSQPGIYRGGNNDGIAFMAIGSQNPQAPIYKGGNNDGFTSSLSFLQNPGLKIYFGGVNDGNASFSSSFQNSLPSIYQGGGNDGVASIIIYRQNSITPVSIKLFYFKGNWQKEDALLSWQANGSYKFSHFELDRSGDGGSQFEKIADIMPLTNDDIQDYTYLDEGAWKLPPEFLLYRLRLVDHSEIATYSNIVKLEKDRTAAIFSAYPNPSIGKLTFNIQNVADLTGYEYQLYSIDGKLMQYGSIKSSDTNLDLQGYAAGAYQLIILQKGTIIRRFKIILSQ